MNWYWYFFSVHVRRDPAYPWKQVASKMLEQLSDVGAAKALERLATDWTQQQDDDAPPECMPYDYVYAQGWRWYQGKWVPVFAEHYGPDRSLYAWNM